MDLTIVLIVKINIIVCSPEPFVISDILEIYLVLDTIVQITGMIIDHVRNHLTVLYSDYP